MVLVVPRNILMELYVMILNVRLSLRRPLHIAMHFVSLLGVMPWQRNFLLSNALIPGSWFLGRLESILWVASGFSRQSNDLMVLLINIKLVLSPVVSLSSMVLIMTILSVPL
jgi:hypothetical protein